MKHRILAGALAALLCPATAHADAPAKVTIRVEGVQKTLVEQRVVTTTTTPVNKTGRPGESCSGTSGAGALEVATGGDWSGQWFGAGFGYSVERVLTETHAFPEPDYYTFWLNNRQSSVGVCGVELQEGDAVLLFVDRCEYSVEEERCTNPPVRPLGIDAPDRVAPGASAGVKVVEYAPDGTPSPAAGATVTGGDSPATTNADGIATLTFATPGDRVVQATKEFRARTESEPLCVTDGADGFCGTARPGEPAPPAVPISAGGPDRVAPRARILGIAEKQTFARGAAPRELRGSVSPDPSGLHAVKLRLTRRHNGRCWYFSKKADGLRRTRCGRSFAFAIGDRADWSYLLPERLGPGRYVLDAVAIDRAFNRDTLDRGRNRVVFTVR